MCDPRQLRENVRLERVGRQTMSDDRDQALPWRLSWWSGWCADHSDEYPELAILGGLLMEAKDEVLEHRRECQC